MVTVYDHNGAMVADVKEWYWDKKLNDFRPGGIKFGLRDIRLKKREVKELRSIRSDVEKALENTKGFGPNVEAWRKKVQLHLEVMKGLKTLNSILNPLRESLNSGGSVVRGQVLK